ncbi:MAG: aminotransferase class I/II-fold pyridoxal phosphate-dependent enzyme [Microbacterium sp.]|uniref:DegT/DnrJ/EryC1/StrS family aminotransferase n=1 Tax=Microbacterium sp. TaxID=51671 RepID=UPI001ACD6E1F|nr:DegT/DnrJ/EryC1/StrS family aminotransferase [Microbacterium sp.]MBN9172676.1 aminotransferase class I/II-fold pyridoxal phosphate-dependent enzyme [Microbacterium sp.]
MTSPDPAFTEPLHVGRPNIGDPEEFLRLVQGALDRRWLSNDGPLVRELETRIAERLGVAHCVATTNGTIALEIAIRALGMTGEVIVPSFTFVATPHSLSWQGITPVFADIDPDTHCLDPASVRRLITPRTTGIIGVHLWGRPAPVTELEEIAEEHGLQLMFDAAHAFGVSLGDRMVGSFGRAEVLSFHATKFFNSVEGGAIVTDDADIARTARLMRNFGFAGEDDVVYEGTNGKMTEVCAAMGLANLGALDEVVTTNRRNYDAYVRELQGIEGVSVLPIGEQGRSNYQYVVMLIDEACAATREEVLAALRDNNVLARRYFWPGCHRMEPYRTMFPEAGANLPETERVAERVIVMPTGTSVDEQAVAAIARIVRARVEAA